MAIENNKGGKITNPQGGDRSGNYDKVRNMPAVNQGISNAGPSGNRNDRADKGQGNTPNGSKGKPGNRSGSKSNAGGDK